MQKITPSYAQFLEDIDTVIAAIDRDEPPSADEKAAVGRLGRKLLVDLGTIANSLERIAGAQERLAHLAREI